MIRWLAILAIAAMAASAAHAAPDPVALSHKMDTLWRAESSRATVTMRVVTPDYARSLSLDVWSEGREHTLIRITAPRKEAGISTLKRGTEMWNYLPKIRKTIRIPPSMMMGSWMGSDLTNDDLVRDSLWEEDYTVVLAPTSPPGQVCLDYSPKPDAPVTWSKVTTCFEANTELPLGQVFFDEKGRAARRIEFGAPREIGGRTVPTRLSVVPLLETGRRTEFTYESLEFGVKHPPDTFSIGRLERGR